VSKEHLKGFFLTPWRPTLEETRERHMDALDHFAMGMDELK
jgi:hypothetical protein